MRIVLAIFLALNLVNLSIEIWSTSIVLVEINEEEEVHVLEDAVTSDEWTHKHGVPHAQSNDLCLQGKHRRGDHMNGREYIEIDSPPPRQA